MRSSLIALALGLFMALALGELLVRLAAGLSPKIRYLATTPASRSRRFASLEEYLASQPGHVIPHRNWLNYWNNALGLNDEEFTVPKPAGRFRIMAVGDSFTYGVVPYPHNVMTLTESSLRAACRGKDLDLLNFGVGGTGVRDYRLIVTLGLATYDPDLVLVNFYAGNDAPDVYQRARDPSRLEALLRHSYLWTVGKNVVKVARSVQTVGAASRPSDAAPPGSTPHGGVIVDPDHPLSESDPALVGPIFTEEGFVRVMAGELRRLYGAAEPDRLDRAWRPTLEDLDAIRAAVAGSGRELVLVVYPSLLQVDSVLRENMVRTLRRRPRYATLSSHDIDPRLPNTRLVAYCRSRNLPCLDLTPTFVEASQMSGEPLYKLKDAHWTIRGNHVAAQAEAAYLAGLVCPAER
jgi:hypothetical protein